MGRRGAISLEIKGAREAQRAFEKPSIAAEQRVIRNAVNAASTPVNKAMKRLVPKETGALQRSIGKKNKHYRDSGVSTSIVGPRRDSKFSIEGPDGRIRVPHKYAHLVHEKTPFVLKAWSASKSEAMSIMSKKMAEGIEREAKKAASK